MWLVLKAHVIQADLYAFSNSKYIYIYIYI